MAKLGDLVRDRISGFEGIVIGRTEWLYGCVRLAIAPQALDKDGKPGETAHIDEDQVQIVEKKVMQPGPVKAAHPGGPRPDATRRADARR